MIADSLVVVMLVVLNGFLAMSELAIVSSRRSRLQSLANQGSAGARIALQLAEQPGHFLSAVQVGITLVGLLAGVFSGTKLAEPLALRLELAGVPDRFSDFIAFGSVVAAVTYLSLVVGEVVPKRVALHRPEAMAALVAPAMQLLTRAAWPLVLVLEFSSRMLLRWIGVGAQPESRVTSDEIRLLIAEAESAGVVPPQARSIMSGALRLVDRKVRTIMTPRDQVDWIDLDQDAAAIGARLAATPHSRLPAAHGNLESVIGVLRTKELLNRYLAGVAPDPAALIEEAPVVLENLSALRAMEVLRASGVHMVLVVDEYGVFQGLITTTNVLEAIAGEFPVQGEASGPSWTRRDDGSWLFDGDLPVDEMAEQIGVVLPVRRDYHTVAGFVLSHIRHVPVAGDSFVHHGWRFEVVDMDDRRIDKVLAVHAGERRPRRT